MIQRAASDCAEGRRVRTRWDELAEREPGPAAASLEDVGRRDGGRPCVSEPILKLRRSYAMRPLQWAAWEETYIECEALEWFSFDPHRGPLQRMV